MLPSLALPCPAMSNAVPWSGLVRTIGSPTVTFTALSHPRSFTGIRPWSWYMATTRSQSPAAAAMNTVSAGNGPCASIPVRRAASIAGPMMRCSSSPNMPFSPACGLRPQTAMRGLAIPNCLQNWWPRSIGSCTRPMVSTLRTSINGRWAVARATRSRGELNIIA